MTHHDVSVRAPAWAAVTLSDLTEVEDFLDVLEFSGVTDSDLVVLGKGQFLVRWRAG